MICGVGLDLVDVAGFSALLGAPFVEATFTVDEVRYCTTEGHGTPATHFAARFAAKEATLKALDSAARALGLEPRAVALLDVEVVRDARGRPSLRLHGAARALHDALEVGALHLSLTHDGPSAAAVVIAERTSPTTV